LKNIPDHRKLMKNGKI